MPVKPITPAEARKNKNHEIPDFVMQAFNEEILQKFDGHSARVKQDDVIHRIMVKSERAIASGAGTGAITREDLFDNHWLDVETIFQDAGWMVEYDKPAYNETGPALF